MFGKAIWDKLFECNFKIFKNHECDLSQKVPEPNMWLLANHTRNLEVDGCQSNLDVMLKQLLFFTSFVTSFLGGILWWTDRCYNDLFLFMQHDNFRNLNRVIVTHIKHLESRNNVFWYCLILQLFDIWRYQSLLIIFFSFVVILIKDESDGVCFV